MKHFNITILLTLLMSMVGARTLAYNAYIDGIYYSFSGTNATVTCYSIVASSNNDAYFGDIVIPETVVWNETMYTVTAIGADAFRCCRNLRSVNIPSSVTSIGNAAFRECSGLTSVNIPSSVTSIGEYVFYNCSSLSSINIPSGVTSIGQSMFSGCSSLTSISVLGDVTFIGNDVFAGCAARLTLSATTPAILGNYNSIGAQMIIRVPDAALTTYRTADGWSSFANRIVGYSTNLDYEVEVNVDNSRSALHEVIGEENLPNVVSLKVTGDINGYDIMVLRNKMDNLHYLDLSDANIVANPYEYVTGQHTEDNVFPAKSFQNLTKLISIKLPNSVTEIGGNAFYGCI